MARRVQYSAEEVRRIIMSVPDEDDSDYLDFFGVERARMYKMGRFDMFMFAFLAVIIPFGVVGNILSFVTWSVGKRCRHLPVSCYFKPLAIIDTVILLVPALEVLLVVSPIKIWLSDINLLFCKLVPYTEYTSSCISMWITVALSIEKTCILYMPFKFANQNAHKRINITVAILGSVSFIMNVYVLVDHTILEGASCNFPSDSFTRKYIELFKWFDILTVYTVPFVILIVCNIMILVKMFKRSHTTIGNLNTEQQSRRQSQLKYTAYQVVAVCIVHCGTTVPYSLVHSISIYEDSLLSLELFFVFYAVRFLNNAINFILYCAIGSDFRQDFKELLTCWNCC